MIILFLDSSAMKSADKIMKMLLYICRQEDKIDQNAYDAIYEAYKLAAEVSLSRYGGILT